NIFIDNPNFGKLTSMHFYAWKKGLKTGMYYLRSKSAADAIKFTVDQSFLKAQKVMNGAVSVNNVTPTPVEAGSSLATAALSISKEEAYEQMACSLDDPDSCLACGS